MKPSTHSLWYRSLILPLAALVPRLPAQVVNPAEKARQGAESQPSRPQDKEPTLSFDRPPILVEGRQARELHEEDRIGPYGQPRWTAKRRFTSTRVYVLPEGQVEFSYWHISTVPKHGGSTSVQTEYEIEFGLPHRFQVDMYLVAEKQGNDGPLDVNEQRFELRHALADWGKIWGNPTLYAEWKAISDEADHFELKLLLGDEIAPRWHWGANLVFEQQTGAERERAHELTAGLSYTVADEKLALGLETKLELENDKSDRGDFETSLLVGPSLQWRPSKRAHLDIAPLFGVTDDSPAAKLWFVFGWEF